MQFTYVNQIKILGADKFVKYITKMSFIILSITEGIILLV